MKRPRGRLRGEAAGGYVRKTVSIPAGTMDQISLFLAKNPGMTLSSFLTDAAESAVREEKGKN